MRYLLLLVLVVCVIGFMVPSVFAEDKLPVPAWIKNNAGWWADGQIPDSAFLQGIQFLIKEGIMVIPVTETSGSSESAYDNYPATETSGSSESQVVPAWIKNNAGWWANGLIDDNAFVSGIQYLIKVGIIVVEPEQYVLEKIKTIMEKHEKERHEKKIPGYLECFNDVRTYAHFSICHAGAHHTPDEEIVVPETNISQYYVSCDTYCNLSLHEHFDVDSQLSKFQDEDLHKRLFRMYVSITPEQILDEVSSLKIYTDGSRWAEGGGTLAAVSKDDNDKFVLWIDPAEGGGFTAESVNEFYYKIPMIHENAHILSQTSSQSDNDAGDTWADVIKKGSTCAPNYYSAYAGCMNDNSYLNQFFQKFFVDYYPSYKYIHEFDDHDEFKTYFMYCEKFGQESCVWFTEFVTYYAATSPPEEDFAESFTAFVLKEKPNYLDKTIADQKILFFYDYPELIEMRDFIRSNL